jgi:hypothetical protein
MTGHKIAKVEQVDDLSFVVEITATYGVTTVTKQTFCSLVESLARLFCFATSEDRVTVTIKRPGE